MIRLLRVVGILMMLAGALVVLSYAVAPLRALWTALLSLPLPILLGLGAAAAGLMLLVATLLWERMEERAGDRELKADAPEIPRIPLQRRNNDADRHL